ncbi:hypothetical protein [Salinisphaera orenii]|uniref:hypothetical protein n=1 Tax=Salinisphaera orenii TaxID=856731 RepID=UPI000DBE564F
MANRKPKSERVNRNAEVPAKFESGWLSQLDGRYNIARQMRQRYSAVCNDLGGEDRLSYMQRSLIERALWLEYWLFQQEQELVEGKDFDVSRWVQAANSLQGIYGRLGLQRQSKPAPSLNEYIGQAG